MSKLGIKTLIVSTVVYLLAANWVLSICLDLASEPDTASNVMGTMGLSVFITLSLALIPFVRKLIQNSKHDLANLFRVFPLVFLFVLTGCSRISPGYVGIKVNLTGSDKGVQDIPLVTGWVFYNPLMTSVMEYPTFVQTASWTKDINEGSPTNEEITFNSKENLLICADISLSYSVKREKVPAFYVKYRSDNLNSFTHGYLRNVARDAFNEIGGTYAVEDILGPRKEQFLTQIRDKVNAHMSHVGVEIDQFGFIGAPRPPQNVIDAINSKIAATQAAMKSENELRMAQAEAQKAIAKAEGEARSQIARAEGNSKSKIILAEGEAKANSVLAQSISPVLLEWRRLAITEQAVQRWDGKRPTVEGSNSGLLLQIKE